MALTWLRPRGLKGRRVSPHEGVVEPLSALLQGFRLILLERCGHEPWREKLAAERFFAVLEEELGEPS